MEKVKGQVLKLEATLEGLLFPDIIKFPIFISDLPKQIHSQETLELLSSELYPLISMEIVMIVHWPPFEYFNTSRENKGVDFTTLTSWLIEDISDHLTGVESLPSYILLKLWRLTKGR